jgi:hypothetical protein
MVFLQLVIMVFVAVSIIALQLSRLSYLAFPDSTSMDVRLMQPPNRLVPIFDTDFGIVIEVSFSQPANASEPIDKT